WPVLAVSVLWFVRKRCVLLFLAPTAALLLLFAVKYHSPWHEGALLLTWLFAFWHSFATVDATAFDQRFLRPVLVVAVGVVLAVQLVWAAASLTHDYQFSYSGSKAVAEFLRSRGLDGRPIYATSFHSIAVLPYFPDSRFANFNGGAVPCYWR